MNGDLHSIGFREFIAEQLYEEYCKAVGGLAFNGDPLPDWETFYLDGNKQKQVLAWLAVSDKVIAMKAIKQFVI